MEKARLLPVVFSSVLFLVTYWGILSGKLHRAIVSVVGAAAMVAAGTWIGFYRDEMAFRAIDFNTIGLLFGMMILVGLSQRAGIFRYLAIRAAKLTQGKPFLLLFVLSLLTAGLSAVLDNVTTIIVVAPVTVTIAGILGISAIPFLLSEVFLSNIGGAATLIGDPPNILIGSAARLSFTNMLTHLAPIAFAAAVLTGLVLLFLFRRELRTKWVGREAVAALDARAALTDPGRAVALSLILLGTVVLYFVHAQLHLGPGVVALIGAAVALLWVRPPMEEIVKDVHWDALVFFIGLFVMVGGVAAAGVLDLVAGGLFSLAKYGIVPTALVVLWAGALLSAIVDNIPFTMAMIPVILGLASRGIDVAPLWWALALGVAFGGNGTPIGSSAGVILVSISERSGMPITTRTWLRYGLPATILSCAIASIGTVLAIECGLF
jgi:Na+/H+ antiporter NhaD/arsenite permease-like protein